MKLLPSLMDMPMSLGDHLDELRRRIIFPILVFLLLFIVGFALDNQLKVILVQPLLRAVELVGPETAARVGLDASKGVRMLTVLDIGESAILSMKVALIFALAVTIPVFLYQAWGFVAVALKPKERALGLLFVPLGVACFYVGLVFAYYIGLPLLQAWLISWTARDAIVGQMDLRAVSYFGNFLQFGIAIGLIFDIPWLVVVLVRVGLVTPQWLAERRRFVILVTLVLAAAITPTSDATTLMITFVPMQLLFEIGLLASRLVVPKPAPAAVEHDDG